METHLPSIRVSRRTRLAALALLPFLAACQRTEVNGIGSYTGDAEQPPQLDVSEVTCDIGEWGWVRASGSVQNPTDSTATYQVMVAFERDGVRLGEGGELAADALRRTDGRRRRARVEQEHAAGPADEDAVQSHDLLGRHPERIASFSAVDSTIAICVGLFQASSPNW